MLNFKCCDLFPTWVRKRMEIFEKLNDFFVFRASLISTEDIGVMGKKSTLKQTGKNICSLSVIFTSFQVLV